MYWPRDDDTPMTFPDIAIPDRATRTAGLRGSLFERLGLSTADVLIVSVAVLLCIAHAPFFLVPSWTPRMLVVLGVLPIGLVALAVRARALDGASVFGLALIAWSVVSGVVANDPAI